MIGKSFAAGFVAGMMRLVEQHDVASQRWITGENAKRRRRPRRARAHDDRRTPLHAALLARSLATR